MSSDKRSISSQINGALSHGPVTEEGKRRSSLNALRHGLLAKRTVNDLESQEIFDLVVQHHMDCFKPEGGVQEGIIEEMVSVYWRMNRLAAIENGMMNQAIAATSPGDDSLTRIIRATNSLADNHRYNVLNTYEGRFRRRYDRAVHTLELVDDYQRRKAKTPAE